jgi:hypothetical protein
VDSAVPADGETSKEQGKANLMALFGKKKGSVAGPSDAKRASTVAVAGNSSATKSSGANWAKDIPTPPPVPSSWPPVSYTGGAVDAGAGDGSGASTPLGEVIGAMGENSSYDPTKPKLRQLYLLGLTRGVAGTLWENNDLDVNVRNDILLAVLYFAHPVHCSPRYYSMTWRRSSVW